MEEKEYNDLESLAAFLHSGKAHEAKDAEERAGMGLPPEPEDTAGGSEVESVLFNAEGRKRQTGATGLLISDLSEAISDIDDDKPVTPARPKTITPDPMIPANPMMRAAEGHNIQRRPTPRPKPKSPSDGISGAADSVKKKFGALMSGAKNKISDIKENISERKENFSERKEAAEQPVKRAEHPTHARTHTQPERASVPAPEDDIPELAASLSAALGVEAAEIVQKNKNALPPEDVPEIYDVEEGSAEEEEFDNTATRLMNAVNDPQARSVSMKDEVDAEEEEDRAQKILAARMRRNYERQKQGTRTLAYILVSLFLCAAILGVSAYSSTYLVKWALDFTGVASADFKIDVTIPEDADIETVAAILAENNIIKDAKFFKLYADFADKLKKNTDKKEFIPGKYTVSSTMSYSTLLSMMRTKTSVSKTVSVRIVEGMTAREIGELLEENNVCFASDFEKYYKNILNIYDFERRVKENTLKFDQLEGYLFPDTYEFYVINAMENGVKPGKGETAEEAYEKMKKESEENAEEAAKKMYSNFNSKITRSMYKRMGEMHFTLDDTIALASMVQKEAASEEDMGNVASVFLNRIRHSAEFPYLQSDVTVLYIENDIKPYIEGTEASKQRIYDAYNTYTCTGIPAGAVCNPGIAAINAVLYAPETNYYYFCANKETGDIFYAETHEQHEENLVLAGLTPGDQVSPMPYGEGE